MAFQKAGDADKSNTLWLRKSDRKTESWHADYRGSGRANGREVWVDGYITKTKEGETVMKLKLRPKASAPEEKPTYKRQEREEKPFHDDEIPF